MSGRDFKQFSLELGIKVRKQILQETDKWCAEFTVWDGGGIFFMPNVKMGVENSQVHKTKQVTRVSFWYLSKLHQKQYPSTWLLPFIQKNLHQFALCNACKSRGNLVLNQQSLSLIYKVLFQALFQLNYMISFNTVLQCVAYEYSAVVSPCH